MWINILKSGGLAKSKKLEVHKVILNSISFFYVIYDIPTCFSHKTPYKSISTNTHTHTYETFRTEWGKGNIHRKVRQCGFGRNYSSKDAVRYIEHNLLCDVLGKDNGLRDVEFQDSIFLEDGLEFGQDLEGHTEFGLDVPIIGVCYHPSLLELS